MSATLDDSLGRLASGWVGWVLRHTRATLAACSLLTLGSLAYAALALGLNTNENDLFSGDLSFLALRDEFSRAWWMARRSTRRRRRVLPWRAA